MPAKGGHAFLRFWEGSPMELKYFIWLWLAIPVIVGVYPTIKGIVEIYKGLKEESE